MSSTQSIGLDGRATITLSPGQSVPAAAPTAPSAVRTEAPWRHLYDAFVGPLSAEQAIDRHLAEAQQNRHDELYELGIAPEEYYS